METDRSKRVAPAPQGGPAGESADPARGRFAGGPGAIPWRGWRDILIRVKNEAAADNLDIVSAGVAFYAMLALFPAIAALVSLYGLIADPASVREHAAIIAAFLPAEAGAIVTEQLDKLTSAKDQGLSLAAGFGIALTVWSASKGVKSMMTALNIVYEERQARGFFTENALALGLSLGAIFLVVAWVGIMLLIPVLVDWFDLGAWTSEALNLLRWPLLATLFLLALGVLYRFGPHRRSPRWQWVSVGAVFSLALWIAASLGFAWYVANFASYNETYGSIGAIIVLLLWFYLSAYVVLIGAELNAEIEHQTRIDTTVGPDRPMGERGARMADTVGETPKGLF